MALNITHLPPEILHAIFSHVEPRDLGWLPLTCRRFNNFIKGNNPLCRAIYLNVLDEPPSLDLDFKRELHDLVRLENLCASTKDTSNEEIQSHLPFVYHTVTRLLSNAAKMPAPLTTSKTVTVDDNNVEDENGSREVTRVYLQPSAVSRKSRARTYVDSVIATTLGDCFDHPSSRRNFLTRSFLYERARALKVPGISDEEHQLDKYGEVSGDETDTGSDVQVDDDEGERAAGRSSTGEGSGVIRAEGRRPRRTNTRFGWRTPRRPREAYQMSAKLHCLYGWELELNNDGLVPGVSDSDNRRRAMLWMRQRRGIYSLACAKVYDLREYTAGTKWGPFMEEKDGEEGVRVDWEKVEAIMLVLGTNIRNKGLERFEIFSHFWGRPFAGTWNGSYIPWTKDREQGKEIEVTDLDQRDPYGVTGSWLRVVSFLDFSDFFHFNFPVGDRAPRDVPRAPLDAGQATRLILMRIRVSKVEPPGPGDHPDHPVTYFTGFSRALDGTWDDNADATICGTVRMTPEGEVRWTSYSVFLGEERWKSEGVQVGGVKSARGVVGTWFDKDFNAQGPCGPTASWKISDRDNTADRPLVLLEDLFPLIADDIDEEMEAEDDDSADEVNLQDLAPFGPDWTEFELEDELDGLYYFDDEDIFDVEDVVAELTGLSEGFMNGEGGGDLDDEDEDGEDDLDMDDMDDGDYEP
ncbi:hypothetical protein B0J18DRAFT_419107 [Chaetomium sp. MPI-SDFR-AT-0129]|nr:hypothetical protein B0J18DRAFT_419107 [Chaetomium sp. MPI-SDFR-AT-0129]